MNAFSHDVGGAVEAYAAYLNPPRGFLSTEEQAWYLAWLRPIKSVARRVLARA
jgi:hypothetical protein